MNIHTDTDSPEPFIIHSKDRDLEGMKYLEIEVTDPQMRGLVVTVLSELQADLKKALSESHTQRWAEMIEFFVSRNLPPISVETGLMAKRVAERRVQLLEEFGAFTAEDLAQANHSKAKSPSAFMDSWRRRHKVFGVPNPDPQAGRAEIYPKFQFQEFEPLYIVQQILELLVPSGKAGWPLAMWFVSNNGWLPNGARPVDMLHSNPEKVLLAAERDAREPAA